MQVFAGLFKFSVINAGEESFSRLLSSHLVLAALNGFLKQLVDVVQGALKKKSLGFMWLSMCLHDVDLHLINHLLKLSVTMATAVITS